MKTMMMRVAMATLVMALPMTRVAAQESGIEVGTKAPAAVVQTLDGQPADLGAVIGKGPVLMEFWATWCPNCKELEPTMLAMQKKYAGKVQFVGVSVSANQSPRAVQAYIEKHGLQMTHFYDARGKAVGAYDVPATSFVVAINKAGQVVYTGLGGKQDLEAAIQKAIK